jgi:hypothetical protein
MRLIVIEDQEIELPQELLDVVDAMPRKIDRKDGAALVTENVFPVSEKTIKSWRLPWECPNGKAIAPPEMYLAYALWKARNAGAGNGRWFRKPQSEIAAAP